MNTAVTDLTVRTMSPSLLAQTLDGLPGHVSVVNEPTWDPVAHTVQIRVFQGLRFVKFALQTQGYAEIVAEAAL